MPAAKEVVYIDPRVAANMADEPQGELVAYIRQDIHEAAVRKSSARAAETVVQIITNPDGRLVGLSSWGRVWAFVSEDKDTIPGWVAVTDFLPQAELDS